MNETACPTLRDGDDEVARKWAAGTLSPAEASEFEAHFLTCVRCQRAIEHAAGITAALRSAASAHGNVAMRGSPRWLLWSAPAILAAGLVIALLPRDPLRRFGNPGPAPSFSAAEIRSDTERDDADRGMAAYQAGQYREAATHLTIASGNGATPGLLFFLGVSRLLSGDPAGAIDPLRRVASDLTSPYAAEAQLWLAKAWLQRGRADSALAALEALGRRDDAPQLSAHARALADSVSGVRRR